MAPKFNTLTIKEVRQETEDCVSVAFQVPDDLRTDYRFIQGQYLTLRETINGEDVRRSYSICSGVESVLSIEPNSTISLFYGNKTTDSVIFKEEIEALKNKNLSRLKVHYIMSREVLQSDLFCGRIDKAKCDQFLNLLIQKDKIDEYFVCGPYQMTMDVRESLEGAGVDKEKIHFELFTTEPAGEQKERAAKPVEEINAKIKVILDGHEHDFNIYKSDETVLDTALKNGADLPFACKGGVCATCKAKIEKGSVDMIVNYGLEPDEIEAGYVLTCQAIPTTDEVTVNFDA
jgi:ring-1,2-phenylacetyl-CoA epoxidase subunit PaaE